MIINLNEKCRFGFVNRFRKLLTATFKRSIDIFVDGSSDPKLPTNKTKKIPEDKRICVRNNGDINLETFNVWKAHGREEDITNIKIWILQSLIYICRHTR